MCVALETWKNLPKPDKNEPWFLSDNSFFFQNLIPLVFVRRHATGVDNSSQSHHSTW